MIVMSFLAGLPPEFETSKSQILSGSEISSLHDTFSRVLHTEAPQFSQYVNSALVSHTDSDRQSYKGVNKGGYSGNSGNQRSGEVAPNRDSEGIECYYFHESGHTKRYCPKL